MKGLFALIAFATKVAVELAHHQRTLFFTFVSFGVVVSCCYCGRKHSELKIHEEDDEEAHEPSKRKDFREWFASARKTSDGSGSGDARNAVQERQEAKWMQSEDTC